SASAVLADSAAASHTLTASSFTSTSSTASQPSSAVRPSVPHFAAGHNIPSVDISSCSRYLAMSCIDCTLRLVDLQANESDGRVLHERAVNGEWGWCVRFV